MRLEGSETYSFVYQPFSTTYPGAVVTAAAAENAGAGAAPATATAPQLPFQSAQARADDAAQAGVAALQPVTLFTTATDMQTAPSFQPTDLQLPVPLPFSVGALAQPAVVLPAVGGVDTEEEASQGGAGAAAAVPPAAPTPAATVQPSALRQASSLVRGRAGHPRLQCRTLRPEHIRCAETLQAGMHLLLAFVIARDPQALQRRLLMTGGLRCAGQQRSSELCGPPCAGCISAGHRIRAG